jgi:cytochrome oxidase Cu insertion factor (SCO1/SenC/PrrC family)
MKTLQRRYEGRDVRFVTFTVDPKNDTPEVLAKFADFWDADPERWFFLTGDRDAIYRLINTSFLMPVMESPDPEPGWEVIHTTNVCLVSPTGRVVGKYNSLSDTEVALMRRDLDGMLDQLAASSTDDSDAPDGGVE